jgi:arylsulfatase A-like enzyme
MGLLTLLACTCASLQGRDAQADVVLVIVDTLRADRMHFAGHRNPTTPNLDAFLDQATWFSRAYSASSWTLPATATLFTGVNPSEHRVVRDYRDPDLYGSLEEPFETLAEFYKNQGFRTAAFINNAYLAPEFNLHQGFDVYDYQGAGLVDHRTAAETFRAGLDWLASDDIPALLVLQVMEPHADYQIAEPWAGTFTKDLPHKRDVPIGEDLITRMILRQVVPPESDQIYLSAAYDEEILQVDAALGDLLAALQDRPSWDDTLFALTSDHGEEFWEFGAFEHGHTLHSVVTQVPLVIHGPGIPAGRNDTLVGHPDLFQALTSRTGALMDAAQSGTTTSGRMVVSEDILYGPQALTLVTDDRRLTVTIPPDGSQKVARLWELNAQGWEGTELSKGGANREEAVHYARILEQLRGSLDPVPAAATTAIPGPETFEMLRQLGYIE